MGAAACVVIINGNRAYASVEELAEKYKQVNTYQLEAAIQASCNVVPYVSLYLRIEGKYLINSLTQTIIDTHARIINELPVVDKANAQSLVDELTSLLFAASEEVGKVIDP